MASAESLSAERKIPLFPLVQTTYTFDFSEVSTDFEIALKEDFDQHYTGFATVKCYSKAGKYVKSCLGCIECSSLTSSSV